MGSLSMETASKLMGAMNEVEDEEAEEMDIKSPGRRCEREHVLLHELHVAKELGMTLTQLRSEMTYEELWLWVTYFGLMNDSKKNGRKKHKDAVVKLAYRRLFSWRHSPHRHPGKDPRS